MKIRTYIYVQRGIHPLITVHVHMAMGSLLTLPPLPTLYTNTLVFRLKAQIIILKKVNTQHRHDNESKAMLQWIILNGPNPTQWFKLFTEAHSCQVYCILVCCCGWLTFNICRIIITQPNTKCVVWIGCFFCACEKERETMHIHAIFLPVIVLQHGVYILYNIFYHVYWKTS